MDVNDSGHIWLRQTVTFTVDGRTRTLEIGIPVPRDATAQDVEALLGVAEAGMGALTRHLDARIAQALDQTSASVPALPVAAQESSSTSASGQAPMATSQMDSEPSPEAAPPAAHSRDTGAPVPRPRPVRPETAPERPATPPPPPLRRPEPSRAQPPVAAASTDAEMTRPEFLSAVATLGLNPRQAMDRLGVRSLEGLNLREALEALRRQLLGSSSHVEPESEPEIAVAPESDGLVVAASAGSQSASRFEEEDDEAILYALDDDDELIEDDLTAAVATSTGNSSQPDASADMLGELDELEMDEMDEVPDLSPPPAPSRSRTAPVARKAATTAREAAAPEPETALASRAGTQAMRLIGKLRMATGGGPASDYQRTAYRNIVENELGRPRAVALVRGLWRTTADRLTSGQMDALIRWGKEEVFAEEAEQVLVALQAEQKRAERESAAGQEAATATEPPARPRGRASGGTR